MEDVKTWEDLEKILQGAVKWIEVKSAKKRPANRGPECRRSRNQLSRLLSKQKKGWISLEIYFEARKKHRELVNIRGAKTDSSGKKFWMMVNKGKKRREGIGRTIKLEEWVHQFETQLGEVVVKEVNKDREKQETDWGQKMPEITTKELEKVINGIKKGKAPGQDGLRSEVWMYRGVRVSGKL